jgi:hypothetical protein
MTEVGDEPNHTTASQRHNEKDWSSINVSPTYGYIESALVKCSNDEGLGPKYNREEDPGSSIFSMLMVYGCYLHLLTFSGKQVTGRINGDPFPPSNQAGLSPPPSPLGYVPRPLQRMGQRSASEKSDFSL